MATAQVIRPGPPGQPGIDYTPNLDNYLSRVARRKETEELENELPAGFPKQLQSDLVWDGKDIAEKYDFTYELNASQLEEIEAALEHFKCSPLTFQNTHVILTIYSPGHAIGLH